MIGLLGPRSSSRARGRRRAARRELLARARALRGVARAAVQCASLPDACYHLYEPEGRMKLISWNVQWCRGGDGRVDPARIVRVCREIADFDLLCLQEVAVNYPGLPGSAGEDQGTGV